MFIYKKNRQGTTLIEIVMAILILACAFIPILRLVDYGSVNTAKIGNYARATRLAQELIEECKHVPFKIYEKDYEGIKEGENEPVKNDYYAETSKNIEKFKEDSKDSLKEFDCKAELRVYKNSYEQISEIWYEVEISWYDMGGLADKKGEKRVVKVGNAYHNPEAIY